MIKITHVITDSNIGGAGILLCNLLSEIDRRDFAFEVILPRGAALAPMLSSLDIPLLEADISPDRSFSPKDFFLFLRILSKRRTNVLHTHGALSARLAGRSLSLPKCILTRHCDTPIKMPSFVYNRTADLTVCTSHPLYEHMLSYGVPREKLRLIVNGAKAPVAISEEKKKELRALFNIPPTSRVIGIVGRLEKIKGQDVFLRGAREVLSVRRDCIFMLVGDGGERQRLEALSARLGISSFVRFCGHRQDAGEIMNLFDVSVNSSYGSETSALAISESLGLAIPVIASDIDGNKRLLNEGGCGLLFKRGDASSLSRSILSLFENDKTRMALSKRGYELYRNELNAAAMARKYEALYRELSKN